MKALALPFLTDGDACGSGAGGDGGVGQGALTCTEGAGSGLPAPEGLAPLIWLSQCGCLGLQEVVLLASGGTRLAGEVALGDELAGVASDGSLRTQVVEKVFRSTQPCLEITHHRGSFICSATHVLVGPQNVEFSASAILQDERRLLMADGSESPIQSVRALGVREVAGWSCQPDHNFISAGVVHHNKTVFVLQPIPLEVLIQ